MSERMSMEVELEFYKHEYNSLMNSLLSGNIVYDEKLPVWVKRLISTSNFKVHLAEKQTQGDDSND